VERCEDSWLFSIDVVDVPSSHEPEVVGSVSVLREIVVQLGSPFHPDPLGAIARAFVQSHFSFQELIP
jgi:hypothetical protein